MSMRIVVDQFDSSDSPILSIGICTTCCQERILVSEECTSCFEERFPTLKQVSVRRSVS